CATAALPTASPRCPPAPRETSGQRTQGSRRAHGSALSAVSTAWPTLGLALGSWLIGLGVLGLALSGAVTSAVGYRGLTVGFWVAAFIAVSPMHDAAHRSVTKRRELNEL